MGGRGTILQPDRVRDCSTQRGTDRGTGQGIPAPAGVKGIGNTRPLAPVLLRRRTAQRAGRRAGRQVAGTRVAALPGPSGVLAGGKAHASSIGSPPATPEAHADTAHHRPTSRPNTRSATVPEIVRRWSVGWSLRWSLTGSSTGPQEMVRRAHESSPAPSRRRPPRSQTRPLVFSSSPVSHSGSSGAQSTLVTPTSLGH